MNWSHKACACLLITLCWSGLAQPQVHLSGNLAGVLTDTTYIVDEIIRVKAGYSLVIQPGATFLFRRQNVGFFIYGRLSALGTQQDSIKFLPANANYRWSGLHFWYGARGSQVRYCVVQHTENSGVEILNTDQVVLSHCSIRFAMGPGIKCRIADNLKFGDCDIARNWDFGPEAGGIYLYGCRDIDVFNCRIMENTCTNSDSWGAGIWADFGTSDLSITNCLFRGNKCGGGFGHSGAALATYYSSYPSIALNNCTIVENGPYYGYMLVSALCCGSPVNVSNCIVRNPVNVQIQYLGSHGSVSCSDVQGGYTGIHNFDADPLFVAGPEGPCYLSQIAAGQTVNSPCLDAGSPFTPMITGTTRTDGVQDSGIVDIGYHYPVFEGWSSEPLSSQLPAISSKPAAISLIGASPNPFNPTTAISYDLQAASKVSLKVYDTAGRLVATLVDGWRAAGTHEITFDGSRLASGVYLYRLTVGTNTTTGKMVLMK